jgi:SAM-dependent methyltransferase
MIEAEILLPDAAIPYIRLQRTTLGPNLAVEYAEAIAKEFAAMVPFLPPEVESVLDIGCGMAGIDVLFWRHYQPDLYLLDGTGMTEERVGFHQTMKPYNSMKVARELLALNGVPAGRVSEGLPESCDLVISLFSWGFHYPVSVYLPLVKRVLWHGGRLLLDLRKGTGGEEALRADFDRVGVLPPWSKADRVCFERK